MAFRPVFVSDDAVYVRTVSMEFEYHNGFSKIQRQRSAASLHDAFKRTHPDEQVLEVSSFSNEMLGIELSAFNLPISLKDGKKVPLEVAFQAGKVFEHGGPYKDLLDASPKAAKKDPRLSESGRIIGFDFEGCAIPKEPKTLFYTWIYLKALNENDALADRLCRYNAFTDIVFNPKKSINCQAFACAAYVSLQRKMQVERALEDTDFLSGVLRMALPDSYSQDIQPVPKKEFARKPQFNGSPKRNTNGTGLFKKNDVINHPKFGEGTVKRIETSESGVRTLLVEFQGTGAKKRLAESWVMANCGHESMR